MGLILENLPLGLPPMGDKRYHIYQEPSFIWSNKPIYHLSSKESEMLQCQVVVLQEMGYIRESMRLCAIFTFLCPIKVALCVCACIKEPNKIMVKFRLPILRLDDMFEQLSSSKVFFDIDLKSEQIKIRPRDKWKIPFKMHHCLYEWVALPFGLSKAPIRS